jgi:fructokinase
MPNVITVGEALVEFMSTEPGVALRKASVFEKVVGAAPARLAVGLARLEVSSGFIGRVGEDPFGHFVADVLAAEGVDVSQLGFERSARTGLAFVSHVAGDKSESVFFRHSSADTLLSPGHINPTYVKSARAIVYDSIGLAVEPCRSGVLKALAIAREAGVLRVYDVNLHTSLWESESEARYALRLGLDRADIVKLNLKEMEFLSGIRELQRGMELLWTSKSRQGNEMLLLVVNLGEQGCSYRSSTHTGRISGYDVGTVEAIGTGDAFLAGLLAELVWTTGVGKDNLNTKLPFEHNRIERILRFACAAAALTTNQRGAVPGLPTRSQVEVLLGATQ